MIKIGILGAGHLGKIHIRLLKEIKDFVKHVEIGISFFSMNIYHSCSPKIFDLWI